MKSYTVLGYYPANDAGDIGDADPVCVVCYREPSDTDAPIFADSEADTPTHCGLCRSLIPHGLTGDGYDYVADKLADGTGDPEVLTAWSAQYGTDCDMWE